MTVAHSAHFLSPLASAPHKPLFVFLPGMDGSGRLLRPQTQQLSHWFDIRCLALNPHDTSEWDSLGHQVSQLIYQEITQQSQPPIQPLAQPGPKPQAQQNQRRRPVYLCGESFGGCLAMQVLAIAPHLFERVILINPASSFRKLPWMQLGPMITRQLPNVAYRYSSKGLLPFLIERHRVHKRDRIALENAMGSVPPQTAAWRMSLLSEFEVERLPLERMNHQVLLIAGGNDRLLPSTREVKSLRLRFPNAQYTLLPKSGHACLLEAKINLTQILEQHQFLP